MLLAYDFFLFVSGPQLLLGVLGQVQHGACVCRVLVIEILPRGPHRHKMREIHTWHGMHLIDKVYTINIFEG